MDLYVGKSQIIVTIPVYKSNPTSVELLSLRQCIRVLGHYDISIFTHVGVDLKIYSDIFKESNVQFSKVLFPSQFFYGIQGYNDLCMSPILYKAYAKYKYMLIYQLDAWVFCDELLDWCNRGYDYVGAPWITSPVWNNPYNVMVGNGGFSLRRIGYFIHVFECQNDRLFPFTRWIKNNYHRTLFGTLKSFISFFSSRNTLNCYIKENRNVYEDGFWCVMLHTTHFRMKLPSFDEACGFSFEKSPSKLYRQNGNRLPFGCHAFRKYEYQEFWSQFIDINM